MPSELSMRKEIAAVCRRVYDKGLVAASDGNVSVRLDDNRYLVTPSGMSKGDVGPNHVVMVDREGKRLAGSRKPTSEILMHLAAYEERPDVMGVVHAHPPMATAFTIAGVSLADLVIPEVIVTLGKIPTAEYATPSSPEGPLVVRKHIRKCDALLLDRHGTLTVGKTLWDAYFKLEKVEHAALINYLARQMGNVRRMSPDELKRLVEANERRGVSAKINLFADNGGVSVAGESSPPASDDIVERVTREVMKALAEEAGE